MPSSIYVVLAVAACIILVLMGTMWAISRFFRKVEQGSALIINKFSGATKVTFSGGIVWPIIDKAEYMDVSVKTIEIDRSGDQGLICADNIRADIKVKFFVRVNNTEQDVLMVAQNIGCARASDQETLEELFSAKFSEALKTAGKSMNFEDLYQARDRFREMIVTQIGDNLLGYALEDAAIDYLEQTPLQRLDANNILDSQGIRKITELTAAQNVVTNELRRNEEMQMKKKNVETQEALLELERQQADATAKQKREVESTIAREEAETSKIKSEEHTRSETARLQSEQQLAVLQENVLREKEVAENNRKRAVVIEEERVTRARDLEIVAREKEVTLQQIEKEKAVEIQKKAIADVIRERIVVDRTVAEQEEAIKEVRVVAEAERTGKSVVITANAVADEKATLEVKAAEAQERKARHRATEEQVMADARLKVAERDAEAKKREAEGLEAITAAPGLAQAKIDMAAAGAKLATMEADATGKEKVGRAEAQVVEAQALAEATGIRARMGAEAEGKEKVGNAEANVRTAEALALSKTGEAEAANIEAKFSAEARGLKDKFEAMAAMSTETREHEEYRMRLEFAHLETLKTIEAQAHIAKEQAEVLGIALKNAKIDIVGGQGDYFDSFVRALSVGKGIDGAIGKSNTLQVAFKDQLEGKRDVVEDLTQLLGAAGQSAGEFQNMGVTALATKLMTDGTPQQKQALTSLLDSLRKPA